MPLIQRCHLRLTETDAECTDIRLSMLVRRMRNTDFATAAHTEIHLNLVYVYPINFVVVVGGGG